MNEVLDAFNAFADAWFPNAAEITLSPKLTTPFVLIAALYALAQPRLVILREKAASRKQAAIPQGEVVDTLAETLPVPADNSLFAPLG